MSKRLREELLRLADHWVAESQRGDTIIHHAGIMQDCAADLRAVLAATEAPDDCAELRAAYAELQERFIRFGDEVGAKAVATGRLDADERDWLNGIANAAPWLDRSMRDTYYELITASLPKAEK